MTGSATPTSKQVAMINKSKQTQFDVCLEN